MQRPSFALLTVVGFLLALFSTGSCALYEQLTIAQAPDRSITVSLHGFTYPCGYFVEVPSVTVSSDQIVLTSTLLALACPGIPGATPVLYTQVASAGVLPDRTYVVTWKTAPPSATTGFSVQTQFQIRAGLLVLPDPEPLPSLSQWSLGLLVALLLFGGCCIGSPLTTLYGLPVDRKGRR